ncbi:NADH-quinone oxidoreductase subunit C, partial [Helicobacter pylori]|nr:NADH-quinone oxidoreductase subunit C [Helicobacter pylori]
MVRKQSPYEDVQKQSRQHDPYKIIEPTPKKYLE